MSFSRKLKRKNDESIKERHRAVRNARKHSNVDVKRKLMLTHEKKKYEV